MVTEVICDDMNTYIPRKTVSRKAGDGLMTSADDELAVKDASMHKCKKHSSPENKDTFIQARKSCSRAERNAEINCGH